MHIVQYICRFLPDGIYLHGRLLGAEKLAKMMIETINDKQRYYEFFKWHAYYSFHDIDVDNQRHDGLCDLCALANNKTRRPLKYLTKFWNSLQ